MADSPLIGTWRLQAWFNEDEAGRRTYPFGQIPGGYICCTPEGFMFVHMSASDRAPFAVNDPMGGTPAAYVAAMTSHITCAGRYTDHGNRVVHHVTEASCPNWVGTDQHRCVALSGDRLALSVSVSVSGIVVGGRPVDAVVAWRRATAAD